MPLLPSALPSWSLVCPMTRLMPRNSHRYSLTVTNGIDWSRPRCCTSLYDRRSDSMGARFCGRIWIDTSSASPRAGGGGGGGGAPRTPSSGTVRDGGDVGGECMAGMGGKR